MDLTNTKEFGYKNRNIICRSKDQLVVQVCHINTVA